MKVTVTAKLEGAILDALSGKRTKGAAKRAMKKAGATALRDMRAEASKRVRARKRIKGKYVREAITLRRPKGGDVSSYEWAVDVGGATVPLVAYPHRKTKRGVSVEVNRGKRTLVAGSFLATMKSGHVGIFRRRGKERLPIEELRGSRPVDALLHRGESEAVAARGGESFSAAMLRLLPIEIEK